MVGAFESVYFTSIHYTLGSWYRTDELSRRAGIFYMSTGLGTMSTGFLASGVVTNLDGVNGLAGWRWLFIVCALITFPVSIYRFIFFPSTPDKTKSWLLADAEKELARERMRKIGGKPPTGFSGWKTISRFLGRWHFWALVVFQLPWVGCLKLPPTVPIHYGSKAPRNTMSPKSIYCRPSTQVLEYSSSGSTPSFLMHCRRK